ncbi:MAG: hypothetical protein R2911_38595 [Caldilineaceae bacterium]
MEGMDLAPQAHRVRALLELPLVAVAVAHYDIQWAVHSQAAMALLAKLSLLTKRHPRCP